MTADAARYNERFAFCYRAWFDGIYRDKYYYLGDAELMAAAFLLDIGSYTMGPVRQVYSDPATQFEALPFDGVPGKIVARVLSFYNRRLSYLALRKKSAGVYGRENTGWRLLVGGFVPDASVGRLFLRGLLRWWRAELRVLFLPRVPFRTPAQLAELAPLAEKT